jgi:hypothetical protein
MGEILIFGRYWIALSVARAQGLNYKKKQSAVSYQRSARQRESFVFSLFAES